MRYKERNLVPVLVKLLAWETDKIISVISGWLGVGESIMTQILAVSEGDIHTCWCFGKFGSSLPCIINMCNVMHAIYTKCSFCLLSSELWGCYLSEWTGNGSYFMLIDTYTTLDLRRDKSWECLDYYCLFFCWCRLMLVRAMDRNGGKWIQHLIEHKK